MNIKVTSLSSTASRGRSRAASRPSVFLSIGAAAILALAACSGPAPATDGSQAEQNSAGESAAQKPAEQKVEAKEYTEPELSAMLAGLKDANGVALTPLPAAELAKGQELQKTTMANIVITPEECRAFANSSAELPEGSVYVGGMWTGDAATGSGTAVTLLSAKPELLSETLDRASGQDGACSTFSMEIAGQKVDTSLKEISVDTAAESETARMITQNMPGGQVSNTVSVVALNGGLLVSVVKLGTDTKEASAAALATIVDQILAASKA